MTEEKMKKRLYALYQLQWMMIHGVSLDDIFKSMQEDFAGEKEYGNTELDLTELIYGVYEHGFYGGQIWACYEEFCDAELQDESYIKRLVMNVTGGESHMLMKAYEKYRKKESA